MTSARWIPETISMSAPCPADGWVARFKEDDGTHVDDPVACWVTRQQTGVLRHEGREIKRRETPLTPEVVGLVGGGEEGYLWVAEDTLNFVGYYRDGTERIADLRQILSNELSETQELVSEINQIVDREQSK